MQITIKRGDNPNAGDVLRSLVNTVFYEDGDPWEPTADHAAGLIEIFGAGSGICNGNVVPIRQD